MGRESVFFSLVVWCAGDGDGVRGGEAEDCVLFVGVDGRGSCSSLRGIYRTILLSSSQSSLLPYPVLQSAPHY